MRTGSSLGYLCNALQSGNIAKNRSQRRVILARNIVLLQIDQCNKPGIASGEENCVATV